MKFGDPIYKGSPSLPGVYCVRMAGLQFSAGEKFAKYDGTRFARPHPTIAQAKAEELVEGRVQQTRVMRREDIEYWRMLEEDSDEKPTEQTKKTSFLALWRAAVDRLLGRA